MAQKSFFACNNGGENVYFTPNLQGGTLHPYLEGSDTGVFFYSNYTYGADKTYTGTIALQAKTWHKLTVKASVENGQLGITVTADDTVAEKTGDITVDPYN